MNELLPYIIKSTLCLSLFYLAFRTVMRKETFFALSRMVLMTIVIFSFIIPLLYLPPIVQEQFIPQVSFNESEIQPTFENGDISFTEPISVTVQAEKPLPYSTGQVIFFIYLIGMLFSFLVFIHGIISILLMFRNAKTIRQEGYLLFILEKDIPAFSFSRMIFISRADYTEHGTTILAHEQQHIRLGHFYDLMLMEMTKMFHWFNPFIYWLIQDLKAIHEFQADQHTLTKGIDARKYQLLIIEKGVGQQRLALANSFNHCQIKKRITMMNKQSTGKAWRWKVATFLPLLALLLMAFGREGKNVPIIIQPQKAISNDKNAQAKDTTVKAEEKVHFIVEEMPEFPGGQKALREYIAKSVRYPHAAEEKKIQGKVSVIMTINSQGKVTNPRIVKSISPELDAEALRVISQMPQWSPGKEKGKPVNVSYTIPINFVLTPDSSAKTEKVIPPPPPPIQSLNIEIKKDGNYVNNRLYPREELAEKATAFQKSNPNGIVSLKMDENVPQERLNEVKEVLKNVKVLVDDPPTRSSTAKQSLIKEHKINNLPPPPPPRVQNQGLLIIMDGENIRVKNQPISMEELERIITGINSKEEFVEIITNSVTNKTLETKIKDLLEKQNISYRIAWGNK